MNEFSGKVIVITGAGSGIGKATAIKLAQLGATLALGDINEEGLKSTIAECETPDTPSDHSSWVVDVRLREACDQFIHNVTDRYGKIHHCFLNAGINPLRMETEHISDDYWDKLVDTNLKGVFNMTRAALPIMRAGSSFVNTSSLCGLYPTAGFAVYCATKYAIIGFSKSVALEVGERGIRVNVIAPGSVETPTNFSVQQGGDEISQIAKGVGLKRIGKPEEIADVVAFLFSDKSRYMNGSVVEIDGGIGLSF